jgi:hypothetical protein
MKIAVLNLVFLVRRRGGTSKIHFAANAPPRGVLVGVAHGVQVPH